MSKLSKLKQEAYQAGKKRDWDEAVRIYEHILELDKNNPALINELGDICLRRGDLGKAIQNFLSAAAKYRKTGLSNNAVAIYKKILRHEESNLNAHWYLAEIRAKQGFEAEGANHALAFLAASENLPSDIKEIYTKRCVELFSLFPRNQRILEGLTNLFRYWSMPLEEARAGCLLAGLEYDAGDHEKAHGRIDKLIGRHPELVNYPEYAAWQDRFRTQQSNNDFVDVNSLNLAGEHAEAATADPREPDLPEVDPFAVPVSSRPEAEEQQEAEEPEEPEEEPDFGSVRLEGSQEGPPDGAEDRQDEAGDAVAEPEAARLDVDPADADEPAPAPCDVTDADAICEGPAAAEDEEIARDEDGCFTIDVGGDSELRAVLDEAAAAVEREAPGKEKPADGSVDLLAEILGDIDGDDLATAEAGQIQTIANEIGSRVGGAGGEDPAAQYDMGLVYLEMGLYDQAITCFMTAAGVDEYAIRSHEMWGITLMRMRRPEEAAEVLRRGLDLPTEDDQALLGLFYQLGRACEEAGDLDGARIHYEQAAEISDSFLDVRKRLASLSTA